MPTDHASAVTINVHGAGASISIHGDEPVQRRLEPPLVSPAAAVAADDEIRKRLKQEQAWARRNPFRYAEQGAEAFEQSESRDSAVLASWTAVPVLLFVGWALTVMDWSGSVLTNVAAVLIGVPLLVLLAAIPTVILVAIPAAIHAVVLETRDERSARRRLEPRMLAERVARETAENDRRLHALGIEV